MDYSERIYHARKTAGYTQETLAEAIGKTRGAVSQWESGETRPRHSTFVAIAEATETSLLWLENGVGDQPGPKHFSKSTVFNTVETLFQHCPPERLEGIPEKDIAEMIVEFCEFVEKHPDNQTVTNPYIIHQIDKLLASVA